MSALLSAVAVVPTQRLVLRHATPADNAALIELAAACPMRGDITLRIDRSPDFFALNRLEGEATRVGVVTDEDGRIIGCVAVARRTVYANGGIAAIAYASDLKVHPTARGAGVADLLTEYAAETAAELCGQSAPVVCTILGGNNAMENRARGPRGMPVLSHFATLSVLAIPLLWERRERVPWVRVRGATERDLEEMIGVWRRYARGRQFAEVRDVESLASWIRGAPGLSIGDYLVATEARSGNVLGFVGVWDQRELKQTRVSGYSTRLGIARYAINLAAAATGGARLPEPGGVLPALATVHACARDPLVLRALLLEAYRRYRGPHYAFMTIGLDARDPLCAATVGLLAQPTLVHAYVTTPLGRADASAYSGRLLHHETALV